MTNIDYSVTKPVLGYSRYGTLFLYRPHGRKRMKRVFPVIGMILLFAVVIFCGTKGISTLPLPEKPVIQPSDTNKTENLSQARSTVSRSYDVGQSSDGLLFSCADVQMETKGISVSQGGKEIFLDDAVVDRSEEALLWIDYGTVQEEYRYEPNRVEQLFHLQNPVGEGALVIATTVETNFQGPVIEVPAGEGGWSDPRMENGGIWFCDEAGNKRIAYYGAMAIDATGRKIDIEPTYDSGEIILSLPAAYMENVSYPLIIDPWIETLSGSLDGKVSNTNENSENVSLCLDSSGNPVIAWAETITPGGVIGEILVHRFNGTSWVDISFSATTVNSAAPSLACDSSGNLYLTWSEGDPTPPADTEILMRRYNGTSWESTESISNTSPAYSNNPVIGVNSIGEVWVAWEEEETTGSGNTEIYVARRDGANIWVGVGTHPSFVTLSNETGGISQSPGMSDRPTLNFDSTGNPVVAWEDSTNYWDIYLRQLDGSGSWIDWGQSGSGGGVGDTTIQSHQAAVAVDPGGYPVVAWIEQTVGAFNVHLRKWTGSQWAELDNSVTNGIATSPTYTNTPRLQLNRMGNPVVSWSQETSTEVFNVYLKYFDSSLSTWSQISFSAVGGGISESTTATLPDLVLDSSGNPVLAWQEGLGTEITPYEIYLRRWFHDSPLNLKQFKSDGSSYLSTGGVSEETTVIFRADLPSVLGGQVRLQIEVQPIGIAFTGNPTGESLLVSGGSDTTVTISGLSKGSKHWRARTVDEEGFASQWVSFGGNADGDTDFAVLEYSGSGGGGGSGLCGLLGFEAVLFVGILFFLRRRL